ncbi:MAG TPA: hypothetical protein VJS65_03625 [Verrucomicrobiae bacterium]|nr:hypothetical protein [Verrucomicrobiae bacterium]
MRTTKRKAGTRTSNAAAKQTAEAINRRRRRRVVRAVAGAVVGGIIAGPLGVAAGAIVGASRKRGPKAGRPKSVSQANSATASKSGKARAGKRRALSTFKKAPVNIYPPIP